MKIKSFEVIGLFDSEKPIKLNFFEDLNILSGRNGSGKTTILKLMWYLISGNLDKAVAEINFKKAIIETDEYKLTVDVNLNSETDPLTSSIDIKMDGGVLVDDNFFELFDQHKKLDWYLARYIGSSFFFPTFRIIEGGFSTQKYDIKHEVLKDFYLKFNNQNNQDSFREIDSVFKKLSDFLSKKDHKFITSISTSNIEDVLVKKHLSVIKKELLIQENIQANLNLQLEIFKEHRIGGKKDKKIEEKISSLDEKLDILRFELSDASLPLKNIKDIVKKMFKDKEINFENKINFKFFGVNFNNSINGNGSNININELSAGEKQILTFLSYNAFYNNTIFFIDEPELSLHTDWQRVLFRVLKTQNSSNQFIISTHSPYIYSKYGDKEVCLNNNSDRGDKEAFDVE